MRRRDHRLITVVVSYVTANLSLCFAGAVHGSAPEHHHRV